MSKDSFKDRFWDFLEMIDSTFRSLQTYSEKRKYINDLSNIELIEIISDMKDDEDE